MIRLAFALLLGMAACPTGEPTQQDGVRLEFTAQEARGENAPPTPGTSVEGGEGRIVVRGMLDTPDPCQKVTGKVEKQGAELTLQVQTVRTGDMCIAMIANFRYDAVLSGLAPGSYRLRVVHTYPGTGWETQTALQQNVTVR